jgi:ribosomal protein S18 acetylase RimI-like enzyme
MGNATITRRRAGHAAASSGSHDRTHPPNTSACAWLARAPRAAYLSAMTQTAITIRPAGTSDAEGIESVHDASWREAYRGIIPGVELERMVARRGASWWRSAIRRGARINVLDHQDQPPWSGWTPGLNAPGAGADAPRQTFAQGQGVTPKIAGYASYGRNRSPWLTQEAEIYELYLAPEFQGLGLGVRLFRATQANARSAGLRGVAVWALSGNDRALAFYTRLGGRILKRSTGRFGKSLYESTAFGWD